MIIWSFWAFWLSKTFKRLPENWYSMSTSKTTDFHNITDPSYSKIGWDTSLTIKSFSF